MEARSSAFFPSGKLIFTKIRHDLNAPLKGESGIGTSTVGLEEYDLEMSHELSQTVLPYENPNACFTPVFVNIVCKQTLYLNFVVLDCQSYTHEICL